MIDFHFIQNFKGNFKIFTGELFYRRIILQEKFKLLNKLTNE